MFLGGVNDSWSTRNTSPRFCPAADFSDAKKPVCPDAFNDPSGGLQFQWAFTAFSGVDLVVG